MRVIAPVVTVCLAALSVWLIFAQAAPGRSLSNAALTRLVSQAEWNYTKREKQSGLVGLKDDIDACCRSPQTNRSQAMIAYCVALDDITTRSNIVYGPGAEKIFPFFSAKAFDTRATKAVTGAIDPPDFKARVLKFTDPAAQRAAAAQHVDNAGQDH